MAESFLVHIVAQVPGAGVGRCGNNFLVQQVLEELHDPSAVQLCYTVQFLNILSISFIRSINDYMSHNNPLSLNHLE